MLARLSTRCAVLAAMSTSCEEDQPLKYRVLRASWPLDSDTT